jgi:hypothetical protein
MPSLLADPSHPSAIFCPFFFCMVTDGLLVTGRGRGL